MGISVKCRSRLRAGSSGDSVTIPKDNFDKVEAACDAFGCKPYFAIVVDSQENKTVDAFITSKEHLLKLFRKRKTGSFWKMGSSHLEAISDDPEIMRFNFNYETLNWWCNTQHQ